MEFYSIFFYLCYVLLSYLIMVFFCYYTCDLGVERHNEIKCIIIIYKHCCYCYYYYYYHPRQNSGHSN